HVQTGPTVRLFVGENNINERQIAKAGILQRIACANPQLRGRPSAETHFARFLQDHVAGSQRHSATGGTKQKDRKREQCTKRTRRDASQDARILAVTTENGKRKIENCLKYCAHLTLFRLDKCRSLRRTEMSQNFRVRGTVAACRDNPRRLGT